MEALTWAEILPRMFYQLTPVWIGMIALFSISIYYKRNLGLYGKLFDSKIGIIGFAIVMFWVFVGFFAGALDMISTHDPLAQVSGMKNKVPGTPFRGAEEGDYAFYLLGGDHLARDVFSRVMDGASIIIVIAPLATLFAFMVGITLGLPAGYYGGKLDTLLSFLANLILAFPVILLFYLLVTPEIRMTGLPQYMAIFLFSFPILFFAVLINTRYYIEPQKRNVLMLIVVGFLSYLYLSLINEPGTKVTIFNAIDGFDVPGGLLTVFVSVVFVNSPTDSVLSEVSLWISKQGIMFQPLKRGVKAHGISCFGRFYQMHEGL